MNRTKEVLQRVESYLKLVRLNYIELEKLNRMEILNSYYETLDKTPSIETFKLKIECAEELKAGELILPLKVKGIFLTEGRPKKKYYTKDALQLSVSNPVNKSFPLALDHKDEEVAKIIGKVNKIYYDSSIKGLRWKGHINSELHARNVLDGTITEVSVTVFSASEYDDEFGLIGIDLTFKELSLIWQGAEPMNKIEVDD